MVKSGTLNQPRQSRSRETLERIVSATIGLLDTQVWDDIAIATIARRARSSVGSFYARFADKAALLDYLDERYAQELTGLLESHVVLARTRGWSLEERARQLLEVLIGYHRKRRGLLRTLVLTARGASPSGYQARSQRINAALPGLIEDFLDSGELDALDAEPALHHALSFTFSALREQILFPESIPNPYLNTDNDLQAALLRNFLGYLNWPEARHKIGDRTE